TGIQGFSLAQAGLKLLTSSDPPASASQSARITGVSHRTWPEVYFQTFLLGSLGLSVWQWLELMDRCGDSNPCIMQDP
uniref:Uncharacterized protein n=1 Tax=Prolemur simus TaxID=1328070 RepID=A0A8C8ZD27_PROSS